MKIFQNGGIEFVGHLDNVFMNIQTFCKYQSHMKLQI